MSSEQSNMKQQFALRLQVALERAYSGRLPSLSTVARDLSLRAPHLPHVSTEAVRKWLRGSAIPQSPRMRALADWLGDDLLEALEQTHTPHLGSGFASQPKSSHQITPLAYQDAMNALRNLSDADFKLVLKLIKSLSRKPALADSNDGLSSARILTPEQSRAANP